MAYLHKIANLYKQKDVLLFKEGYALEKIDGTSVKINYNIGKLTFLSGCINFVLFKSLFKEQDIKEFLDKHFPNCHVEIYGEGYGGRIQKMSETYGKDIKAVFFEVVVNGKFLSVPNAEEVVKKMGLEYVFYNRIPFDMVSIDAERESESQQAIRNGCGTGKRREGIILRPLTEMRLNDDSRVIAKYKNEEWRETSSPRVVGDVDKLKILEEANAIAFEWVTTNRLNHVLQNFSNPDIRDTPNILKSINEDILLEAAGEIKFSEAAAKSINKRTVELFKGYLKGQININS